MRIAIALFDDRVSPRFDCAPEFSVVEVSDGRASSQKILSAGDWHPNDRVVHMRNLGIEVLICGGIDHAAACELHARGIRLFSWVNGNAKDALAAFLQGRLKSDVMVGAGGRCCGRWMFRSGCRAGGASSPSICREEGYDTSQTKMKRDNEALPQTNEE